VDSGSLEAAVLHILVYNSSNMTNAGHEIRMYAIFVVSLLLLV
jgi:hypothetical protein